MVFAHLSFDYGSSVRVKTTPNPYEFSQGSVCGFRTIDDPLAAKKRGVAAGTVYVFVENESGLAIEMLASDLEVF